MNKKIYKKTIELNGLFSRATGTVVFVDKKNAKKKDNFAQFIKISDCHDSVYLHPNKNIHKSKEDFKNYINKVKALRDGINEYLIILESEK